MSAFCRGSATYFFTAGLWRKRLLHLELPPTRFHDCWSMSRPREKNFPNHAYLPGKHPHPVRDPLGHSYQSDPVTVVAVEESLVSLGPKPTIRRSHIWRDRPAPFCSEPGP